MIQHKTFQRLFILGLILLVSFCLVNSIKAQSFMGFILALVSLGAGIYFLYLLARANKELEKEKEELV